MSGSPSLIGLTRLIALLLLSSLTAGAADDWYTVQTGDSIATISAHFGVSPQTLSEHNRLAIGDTLLRGQILRIPIAQSAPLTHVVRAEDSLQSIAARYGVAVESLMAENNILSAGHLIPGQTLHLPAAAHDSWAGTHIVQRGESLQKIGAIYGVDWRMLARVNNIAYPNRINIGQVLLVPDADQVVAMSASEAAPVATSPQIIRRIYIVQGGDSLAGIAQRYVVPLDSLRALNGFVVKRDCIAGIFC